MKPSFIAILFLLLSLSRLYAEDDIIQHIASHAQGADSIEQTDDRFKLSTYGDQVLDQATHLFVRHRCPWPVLINWQTDGSFKLSKYGDLKLDQAEEFLSFRYPHPWTVSKVIGWIDQTSDTETLAHLLDLLAVSRTPKAALALGDYLRRDDCSWMAYERLNDYFLEDSQCVEGGARSLMGAVHNWLSINKERLEHEAW